MKSLNSSEFLDVCEECVVYSKISWDSNFATKFTTDFLSPSNTTNTLICVPVLRLHSGVCVCVDRKRFTWIESFVAAINFDNKYYYYYYTGNNSKYFIFNLCAFFFLLCVFGFSSRAHHTTNACKPKEFLCCFCLRNKKTYTDQYGAVLWFRNRFFGNKKSVAIAMCRHWYFRFGLMCACLRLSPFLSVCTLLCVCVFVNRFSIKWQQFRVFSVILDNIIFAEISDHSDYFNRKSWKYMRSKCVDSGTTACSFFFPIPFVCFHFFHSKSQRLRHFYPHIFRFTISTDDDTKGIQFTWKRAKNTPIYLSLFVCKRTQADKNGNVHEKKKDNFVSIIYDNAYVMCQAQFAKYHISRAFAVISSS